MSEPTKHFWVNGVVAVRDKMPYVQLSTEAGVVVQLDIAQARQVAADILQMAARTEADALLHRFCEVMGMPEEAGPMMMQHFRDFRAELDSKGDAERV